MVLRPAERLIWLAAATALIAAAGGAALAQPARESAGLTPVAQLAGNGGVTAPGPSAGGGMQAPSAQAPAPPPVQAEQPPAAPAPTTTEPGTTTAPDPLPETTEPEAPDGVAEAPASTLEDATAVPAPAPDEPPSSDDALGAQDAPLVPAEVLPLAVRSARAAPLIDISPTTDEPAAPLRPSADLPEARPAQAEDPGDEVVIPVPQEDIDQGVNTPAVPPPVETPAEQEPARALPFTGSDIAPPLVCALFLLLAGAALRAGASPSGGARARA